MQTRIYHLLSELFDKTIHEASIILRDNGCLWRIVSEDGYILERGHKYVENRINLHISNGIVVDAEVG